jgi:predicted porin
MQKKIIALAVAGLMSGAAFAQTNVTLSGNVDLGYYKQSIQTGTVMDTGDFRSNGSSTSTLTIAVTEDLGGGMKAGFVGSTDWAPGGNASVFLNSQNFLSLSGNFGEVRFGNINTAALSASSASQPFGTAIGSGYSGAFARLSRTTTNGTGTIVAEGEVATATAAASGARSVRLNQSGMYISPNFNGFRASYQHVFRNSDAAVAAGGQQTGVQALGLSYNAGPLNVNYAHEVLKNGPVAAPAGGIALLLGANEKVTHNLLGANYKFGPATVYGGYTTSKSSVAATANSRSWNIAGKYDFTGNIAGMINYVKVNDKLVGNQDRKLLGLGLDYGMSKRTTAYARYERGDNDKAAATGDFNRYQIGLRHSF